MVGENSDARAGYLVMRSSKLEDSAMLIISMALVSMVVVIFGTRNDILKESMKPITLLASLPGTSVNCGRKPT